MKQSPSRILNEPSNVMGLVASDILALAAVFMVTQKFLHIFGLEIFAIIVAAIAAIILSIIRMKYRRKIIRDSISYLFRKFFLSGLVYVREISRTAQN